MKFRPFRIALLAVCLLAPAAFAAENSEQVVFSGTGFGTFNNTSTPFGFWIWCEDESNNKYAGRCHGAMYYYGLGITRSVKGTIDENEADEYILSVFSSKDDSIDCTLQSSNPVQHGPHNTVTVQCTAPSGSGTSSNAVVNVTGPEEEEE
jgi:hypothetical protein